jgi:hypothetical protein
VLRARVERTNLEPLLIQARNDRELAYWSWPAAQPAHSPPPCG